MCKVFRKVIGASPSPPLSSPPPHLSYHYYHHYHHHHHYYLLEEPDDKDDSVGYFCFVLFWFWFLNQGDHGPQAFTILRSHLQMVINLNLKGTKSAYFSLCWCHHHKSSNDKRAPFFLFTFYLSPHPPYQVFLILPLASLNFSLKLSQPQISSADMPSQNLNVIFYSAWNTAVSRQHLWGSIVSS